MKDKLKVGQRVLWYEQPGQIVTVPTDPGSEYGVKLDTGQTIFDDDTVLLTSEGLERLSTSKPILE